MNDRAADASADDIEQPKEPLTIEAQSLFDAAFREHHAVLLRFLRRRVGDADARDIAQEAYLRVLRYRDNQNLDSLKLLLFRIANNLVFMRGRSARTHHLADHVSLEDEPLLAANDPALEQQLGDRQRLALILSAIKDLPEKRRYIFVLSRFHGMSNAQIAEQCGISVRMVEKQITKALAACRAQVRD